MSETEVEFGILLGADAPVRSFKPGEVVYREGDPATELYVVKSGKVDIVSGGRHLATIEALGIFGEMALIDGTPRSATVTAATDVEVVAVDEKQFLFLVSQTPFFALRVMRSLAARLRAANKAN